MLSNFQEPLPPWLSEDTLGNETLENNNPSLSIMDSRFKIEGLTGALMVVVSDLVAVWSRSIGKGRCYSLGVKFAAGVLYTIGFKSNRVQCTHYNIKFWMNGYGWIMIFFNICSLQLINCRRTWLLMLPMLKLLVLPVEFWV